MSRVQTLSDSEYKVLLAIREATAHIEKTAQIGSKHLQTELESIYHDLDAISGFDWEDVIGDIRRRLYQLLH